MLGLVKERKVLKKIKNLGFLLIDNLFFIFKVELRFSPSRVKVGCLE
jgi:hypothetical protein